jgi:hypothetical protein
MYLTVIPAYGRDYKSGKAAREDWLAGKDFRIADMFSGEDGRYINKQDADQRGITVTLRFNRLAGTVTIKPAKPKR